MSIKKIRFWCNKVIPLVYDDSLSYYELLCKVVAKINEIIDTGFGISISDPIEWNITSQYPQNVIVIDNSGTAYISKQPVPIGVELSNEEYWLAIFNYGDIVNKIEDNIAENTGDSGIVTANKNQNDIVWYKNELYYLLNDLPAGGVIIPDTNATKTTLEKWIKNNDNNIIELISNEVQDREEADSALGERITAEIDNREKADTALGERITAEIGNREEADTALGERITAEIGNREEADTALGERITTLENLDYHEAIYINVKDYGAKGDNVTDDTEAFEEALNIINTNGGVLYVPQGRYKIARTLKFTHYGSTLKGETQQGVYIIPTFTNLPVVQFGDGNNTLISARVENIGITTDGLTPTSGNIGIFFNKVVNSSIDNVVVGDCLIGVRLYHAGNTFLNNVGVVASFGTATGFFIGTSSVSTNIENCYCGFMGNATEASTGIYCGEGTIADLTVNYFDCGNGGYGIVIDGSNNGADTPPTDIRLNNIVVDGTRNACIRLLNIPHRSGIVIDGGWLNPLATANNICIQAISVQNLHIRNVHLQQLTNSTPILTGITGSNIYDSSIEGCIFSNINSPVSFVSGVRIICSNNSIYSYDGQTPTSYGIALNSSRNLIITSNIIRGGYLRGISIDSSGDYSVVSNNIVTGSTTGIVDEHVNNVVDNNISY